MTSVIWLLKKNVLLPGQEAVLLADHPSFKEQLVALDCQSFWAVHAHHKLHHLLQILVIKTLTFLALTLQCMTAANKERLSSTNLNDGEELRFFSTIKVSVLDLIITFLLMNSLIDHFSFYSSSVILCWLMPSSMSKARNCSTLVELYLDNRTQHQSPSQQTCHYHPNFVFRFAGKSIQSLGWMLLATLKLSKNQRFEPSKSLKMACVKSPPSSSPTTCLALAPPGKESCPTKTT